MFLTAILLLLLNWAVFLAAHPQCLDGKPPFQSRIPLDFCTEYRDNGCCTYEEDQLLRRRYEDVFSQQIATACLDHIKSIMCQRCSPYAAHLYSYEETGVVSPLPGLCTDYCREVYFTCGVENLKVLVADDQFDQYLTSWSGFCSHIKIADEDYCYPDLLTNQLLIEQFTRTNSDTPDCICLQKTIEETSLVTFIVSNPTSDDLLYVGEQRGVIQVYDKSGKVHRRPFLDLSNKVLLSESSGDERGLLGMAFHPNFKKNRRFYLYYIIRRRYEQVARVSQWVARHKRKARRRSEKVLLEMPQPYFNHNGGQLLFGVDGYLYIFTGDGGSSGDPHNNSQNKTTLLGKVLRLNVNRKRKYTIPASNPFVYEPGSRAEIYAYGLRNPWGCSVDRGDPITGDGKGRIFCSDVGQNKFEEVDIIVRGGNYGWSIKEGLDCYKKNLACDRIENEVLPIHTYDHSYGKSITGGYVYRGCDFPNLNGAYIYGDYTSGRLFKLTETNRNRWRNEEINMCSPSTCTGNWASTYGKGVTAFGTNRHGDIFMASSGDKSAYSNGTTVYKLIMQPFRRSDPSVCRRNRRLQKSPSPDGISEYLIRLTPVQNQTPANTTVALTTTPKNSATSTKPATPIAITTHTIRRSTGLPQEPTQATAVSAERITSHTTSRPSYLPRQSTSSILSITRCTTRAPTFMGLEESMQLIDDKEDITPKGNSR